MQLYLSGWRSLAVRARAWGPAPIITISNCSTVEFGASPQSQIILVIKVVVIILSVPRM